MRERTDDERREDPEKKHANSHSCDPLRWRAAPLPSPGMGRGTLEPHEPAEAEKLEPTRRRGLSTRGAGPAAVAAGGAFFSPTVAGETAGPGIPATNQAGPRLRPA